MASAAARISAQDYLKTHYELQDPEYVDGELIERSLPNLEHSTVLKKLLRILDSREISPPLVAYADLTVRIDPARYRIPDVVAYAEKPTESHPSQPPFIVVEILSPDDRMSEVLNKLADYEAWQAKHIWLIDPSRRQFYVFRDGAPRPIDVLETADPQLAIKPQDVF